MMKLATAWFTCPAVLAHLLLAGISPARADSTLLCIDTYGSACTVLVDGKPVRCVAPPGIWLTLQVTPNGAFFDVAGEGVSKSVLTFVGSDIVAWNEVLIYSVSGTAIPNSQTCENGVCRTDGYWVSLAGAGYNRAASLGWPTTIGPNEVFLGTFALQLSADSTKNKLTYVKQGLDGSPPTVITLAPEIPPDCPTQRGWWD